MVLCFYADSSHQEYKFLVSHWPLLLELGLACLRGNSAIGTALGEGGYGGGGFVGISFWIPVANSHGS